MTWKATDSSKDHEEVDSPFINTGHPFPWDTKGIGSHPVQGSLLYTGIWRKVLLTVLYLEEPTTQEKRRDNERGGTASTNENITSQFGVTSIHSPIMKGRGGLYSIDKFRSLRNLQTTP